MACPTACQSGRARIAAGMNKPLKIARLSVIRSQVQYRPVVIAATTISNAPPTAIDGRTPKKPKPARTPMNSVINVIKFPSTRSPIEKKPQNFPKRSNINSAWPRWVTAPKRTVISCTMKTMTKVSTKKGMKKHAGVIVFAQENQHSRSDQQPKQPDIRNFFEAPAFRSGTRYFPAVTRAVHVFVGQKIGQLGRGGGRDGRLGGRMGRFADGFSQMGLGVVHGLTLLNYRHKLRL